MDSVETKQRVCSRIDSLQEDLWKIVTALYENPEIAFEEFCAADLIQEYLSKTGFKVESPLGGIKTAFQGVTTGNREGPVIAFLAEYDALPKIGHACGHNLIAAAAVGAGVGISPFL